MTYRRFSEIRRAFCFSELVDESGPPDYERLEWISDAVFKNGTALYSPTSEVTLDDQSIRFYGRCGAKRGPRQKKADASTISFYALNDARGFTLGLRMMTKLPESGAEQPTCHTDTTVDASHAPDEFVLGRRDRHILTLLQRWLPNPRGSQFTSYPLFNELYKIGMLATGTIKKGMLTHGSAELKLAKECSKSLPQGIRVRLVV
jgi:hypothetical protein